MKVLFWVSGVFLCAVGCVVYATSLGWVGEPKIVSIDDVPAICLPNDAEEEFPVYRVMVSESHVKNSSYWALYLEPNKEALIMKPGGCIKFGEVLKDYKLEGDLTSSKLKLNSTYSFTMDRVRDEKHYNYFYSAAFCVKESPDGSLVYPQYTRLSSGGEVAPSCDAKRNGTVSEQIVPEN